MTTPIPNNLLFGLPREFKGLAIAPIFDISEKPALEYITLDEAFRESGIEITEVSDSGNVPELKVQNRLDTPVLFLDGEELVGAKQNRVINLTILFPPNETATIPLSCVEAGRWSYRSDKFESSDRTHFARGRAKKMASVSFAMQDSGTRSSNQGELWAEIDTKFSAMCAESATSAMAEMYDKTAPKLDEYVREFSSEPDQVGAFYFLHGQLFGMDLFDQAKTFKALCGKLIKM